MEAKKIKAVINLEGEKVAFFDEIYEGEQKDLQYIKDEKKNIYIEKEVVVYKGLLCKNTQYTKDTKEIVTLEEQYLLPDGFKIVDHYLEEDEIEDYLNNENVVFNKKIRDYKIREEEREKKELEIYIKKLKKEKEEIKK